MKQKRKLLISLTLVLSLLLCTFPALAEQSSSEESGDTVYHLIAVETNDGLYVASSLQADISDINVIFYADGQTATINGGELVGLTADFTYTREGDKLIIPDELGLDATFSGNLLILNAVEDGATMYCSLNPAIQSEEQFGEKVSVTGIEDLAGTWLYRYVADADFIIDVDLSVALNPEYTDGFLVLSEDGTMTLTGLDGKLVEDQFAYADGMLINLNGTTLSLTTEGYLAEDQGSARYYYTRVE